ncbi:peptidoglycan-binding protein [Streptomyces sp. NPDC057638]|uniref:peptidoglycan-binding protein n=1 Tax=Streptomyces sp. NPDC057638 TaxID=3346190 RepID=UPI0036BB4633
MATPLSADVALRAFTSEGLNVRESPGWRTHNRNHVGPWGPAHGVMIHHTGRYSTEAGMVGLCYNGRSDLPGPLCHTVIGKTGTAHMVGWGRCNHAGLGDAAVLAAVKAERPVPAAQRIDTDGNRYFYGVELINRGDGRDPWPAAQLDAAVRWAAALCRAHGWSERSIIGHLGWQRGKVDPKGFSMADFRARVHARLADSKPGGTKPPTAGKPVPARPLFPGRGAFGPGKVNDHVLTLGRQLVKRGYGDHYKVGPSPTWSEADRRNVEAFQRAQGWTGSGADGLPGPDTWRRLFG